MIDLYEYSDNFALKSNVTTKERIKGETTTPFISVFIPTYRRSETLKETIESVIKQKTTSDFEIIIINNDPSENDADIISHIIDLNDSRISYYCNEENIGLCGNWNRGIELAKGQYISMIHDDDVLSPWYIESLIQSIIQNNEPGIIGVSYIPFTSTNMPDFIEPNKTTYSQLDKKRFFFGRSINIAGMAIKKEIAIKLGGYREEYYPNEDTFLIYKCILMDRVININFPLAGYRKEINLSLTKDVMMKTIVLTEVMRRNIAKHETFANIWMRIFDKEYLYNYVQSANKHWNMAIDYKEVFSIFSFPPQKPNKLKIKIMNGLIKICRGDY